MDAIEIDGVAIEPELEEDDPEEVEPWEPLEGSIYAPDMIILVGEVV